MAKNLSNKDIVKVQFTTDILKELTLSQLLSARYLEYGYLSLNEFPEIAKQVRLTADDAQTQHIMSLGLMKQFHGTADHVVESMIPLMREGVELEEVEIVKEAMTMVIGYAKDMKAQTLERQEKYFNIKKEVTKHIATVEEKNITVRKEGAEIDADIQEQKNLIKAAKAEYTEVEKEKEKMEENLKKMREQRDELLQQSVQTEDEKLRESLLDSYVVPSIAVAGTLAGGPVVGTVLAVGGWIANSCRRDQSSEQALTASDKTQELIEKEAEEKRKAAQRLVEIRETAMKRVTEMRKLALNKANLGDVKNLELASNELGKVHANLGKIAIFWEDFAAKLEHLSKVHDPAKVLLLRIENKKVAERFEQRLGNISTHWEAFGNVCSTYEKEHRVKIETLYKFLSTPVDRMTIKQREERQDKLIEDMENDIKAITF